MRRMTGILMCCLLATASLVAQTPTVTSDGPSAPSASGVLSGSLSSMGAAGIAGLGTGTLTAVITADYVAGGDEPTTTPFTIRILGFDNIRFEVGGVNPATTVIKGAGGWSTVGGKTTAIPVQALVGRRLELFPILALARWTVSPRAKAAYVGLEPAANGSLHHIRVSELPSSSAANLPPQLQALFQWDVLVDSTSLLPVSIDFRAPAGDWRRTMPARLEFSGYTEIGGVLMPTTIARYDAGQKTSEIHIHSVTFNVPVADDLFRR